MAMNFHLETGLEILPMPGEQRSGDTGMIEAKDGLLTATLIDVLGHGDQAADLADKTSRALSAWGDLQPLDTIERLHQQFRGSRGMVASCASIHADTGILEYCGIGNISARIFGSRTHQFVNRDGVVGYRMVSPKTHMFQLQAGDVFIMHSDGITSRFYNEDIGSKLDLPAQKIAEHIMHSYNKGTDDTSCLVVKVHTCR